jgi:hypothetical protein
MWVGEQPIRPLKCVDQFPIAHSSSPPPFPDPGQQQQQQNASISNSAQ